MKAIAFANRSVSTLLRRIGLGSALAGAVLFAPAVATITDLGVATASAQPGNVEHHGGPDYLSITGWRVGAPSEQEVSSYGGSNKHSFIEQQLYGHGVVIVPHVDTSVQQSR